MDKLVVDKLVVDKPRCQFGYSKLKYLGIPNSKNQFSEYKKPLADLSKSKLTSDVLK